MSSSLEKKKQKDTMKEKMLPSLLEMADLEDPVDMKDAKDYKDKELKFAKDKEMKEMKGAKDPKGWKDKMKIPKEDKLKQKADKVIKSNDKKKRRPKKRESWVYYIHKVLKSVHEDDCALSSKAMGILDSFAHDLFDRISTEAVRLMRLNNKRTLTFMEVQTAARLVLPGELCKHALYDGAKAVSKYQLANENAL